MTRMQQSVSCIRHWAILLLLFYVYFSSVSCDTEYLIGVGNRDITGLVGGVPMSAYVNPQQVADGIHMRLRSRGIIE